MQEQPPKIGDLVEVIAAKPNIVATVVGVNTFSEGWLTLWADGEELVWPADQVRIISRWDSEKS